ncbi:MAG: biopolymer transporter ExbD [Polyangiaceae bacterium]|jgi:biopolymer transport protein ExbD|nr:biopolymer transporter ExbD [Polyangiaceae bacterium]
MAGGMQSNDDEIIAGINVTPLVDITLVLLVVMMITAKAIVSQALPMDLPKAASGSEQQDVFSVSLGATGETAVNQQRVPSEDAILAMAREAHAKNAEVRAVIKADAQVPHGRVVRVMDLLKQAGISKVAFGVSPVPNEGGGAPAPAPAASPK